jgi:two-component system, NtrC family, sensor kinase
VKLAQKFTATLIMVVVVVLSLRGFFDTTRALTHYEQEVRSSQHDLGETLQLAVTRIWEKEGWEASLSFLEEVQARGQDTEIRWTWLDEQELPEYRPRIPVDRLLPLLDGDREINVDRSDLAGYVITYKPVFLRDLPLGALEFTRSTAPQRAHAREEVNQQVLTNLLVILVYALVASIVGRRLVARPMTALIDHARRVGEGEFSVPSDLASISQRDEIGQLASEMNRMSGKLLAARNRAERERRARMEVEAQLRHADRLASIGRLAASFIHDIGTPLTVIAGRASMIVDDDRDGGDAKNVRESAERIAEQANRISATIRRFLDFARKGTPERTQISLLAIVKDAIELLEPMAKKSQVRLTIAEGASDVEARVDKAQIQQVVANLITNAIQAMPAGGRVTVAVGRDEVGGFIEVSDEGPGIPESDRESVFEPFFTTKAEGQGTGLGLSVCKNIVESHAGRIELGTAASGGARFICHFPLEGEPA